MSEPSHENILETSHSGRVAGRIQALRKKTGLNQSRFAERIGVERSYYSHVENGRIKPSLEMVVNIAASFYPEFEEASPNNIIYDPLNDEDSKSKYSPHNYFVKNLDARAVECAIRYSDQKEREAKKLFSSSNKTILFLELLTAYERAILAAMEEGLPEFTARQQAEDACSELANTFGPPVSCP